MKKLFTLIALVASVCLSMSLSSCGDDEITPKPPVTKEVAYSTSWLASGSGESKAMEAMVDFLNQKLGKIGEAKIRTSFFSTEISISATDKAKADAIFKSINDNTEELDAIMNKIDGLVSVWFEISYLYSKENKEVLLDYKYSSGSPVDAAGTYSYTETFEGANYEWTATITSTPDEKQSGFMLGSLVLPREVEGLSAGKYDGLCRISQSSITFMSNQKNEHSMAVLRLSIDLSSATEDGKYTASLYTTNNKVIFEKVLFSKK